MSDELSELRSEVAKGFEDAAAGRLSARTVSEIARDVANDAHVAHLRRLADQADAGETIRLSHTSREEFIAFMTRK